MEEKQIYTDELENIETALEKMTNDWIENGEYSDLTVITLRDALKYYYEKIKAKNRAIVLLSIERDALGLELESIKEPS